MCVYFMIKAKARIESLKKETFILSNTAAFKFNLIRQVVQSESAFRHCMKLVIFQETGCGLQYLLKQVVFAILIPSCRQVRKEFLSSCCDARLLMTVLKLLQVVPCNKLVILNLVANSMLQHFCFQSVINFALIATCYNLYAETNNDSYNYFVGLAKLLIRYTQSWIRIGANNNSLTNISQSCS